MAIADGHPSACRDYCQHTSTPVLGPDGYFHMAWMWRDTPDVSTNHLLSYARTKDYVNWENVNGVKLSLPLTEATPAVVDLSRSGRAWSMEK